MPFGTLIAATDHGVARLARRLETADGGRTWSRHLPGALRDCHSLAFHPPTAGSCTRPAAHGGGASRSDDAGETWHQPHPRFPQRYGWACALDPADPADWCAFVAPEPKVAHGGGNAGAAIWRFDGSRWSELTGGLPTPLPAMPYALLTDRGRPGALLAVVSDGSLWLGEMHGDRWTRLDATIPGFRRVAIVS